MDYINMCPHPVEKVSGKQYPLSGYLARVRARQQALGGDLFQVVYSDMEIQIEVLDVDGRTISTNLVPVEAWQHVNVLNRENTRFIVSGLFLTAVNEAWQAGTLPTELAIKFVAPNTAHPGCIRNETGQVVAVPGFVASAALVRECQR